MICFFCKGEIEKGKKLYCSNLCRIREKNRVTMLPNIKEKNVISNTERWAIVGSNSSIGALKEIINLKLGK